MSKKEFENQSFIINSNKNINFNNLNENFDQLQENGHVKEGFTFSKGEFNVTLEELRESYSKVCRNFSNSESDNVNEEIYYRDCEDNEYYELDSEFSDESSEADCEEEDEYQSNLNSTFDSIILNSVKAQFLFCEGLLRRLWNVYQLVLKYL
ncbi:hypothetical protein HK099_003443 [Clydaea vesicula]|uniref:Uncharacterized protein n=1 Tax=Clydaea vesicula TaxID=447962 RepID=A0AAD5TSR1_9FUNG|nr:hypothetical protein HK099_003443 [Clydaea vesicula]